MEEIKINIEVKEYQGIDELNHEDKLLFIEAQKAAEDAYAPYSGFKVGAALRLENDIICTGNNQENVAYPSGLCAERVALFHASSNYPGIEIHTVAIAALTDQYKVKHPVTPCGACRQVLAEYETKQNRKIRVIYPGEEKKINIIEGIENILPFIFRFGN